MPTKVEKDEITGQHTTGHEWDGIKELNTPLPKWWLYIMYATIVWSVIWWLLYPSWPGITGYFHGLLGANERLELDQRMAQANARQAEYMKRISQASLQQITQDPDLLNFALAGGAAAFATNCAPCHGLGGAGQGSYPSLADDSWLWGGTLDAIQQTITYGIRNGNDNARNSEMPAFGADQLLTHEQINDVAEYVLSLSGRADDAEAAKRGATVFADQCAVCHGDDGKGNQEVGAPDLTDQLWMYGGTKADIVAQIFRPRMGVMPIWGERLSPDTIKLLTVYVHSLGGGQ